LIEEAFWRLFRRHRRYFRQCCHSPVLHCLRHCPHLLTGIVLFAAWYWWASLNLRLHLILSPTQVNLRTIRALSSLKTSKPWPLPPWPLLQRLARTSTFRTRNLIAAAMITPLKVVGSIDRSRPSSPWTGSCLCARTTFRLYYSTGLQEGSSHDLYKCFDGRYIMWAYCVTFFQLSSIFLSSSISKRTDNCIKHYICSSNTTLCNMSSNFFVKIHQ
jgi:hypothetical protein